MSWPRTVEVVVEVEVEAGEEEEGRNRAGLGKVPSGEPRVPKWSHPTPTPPYESSIDAHAPHGSEP